MRFWLAAFCVLICGNAASAQYGVVNRRDASGNLVRSNGTISPNAINQGPVNNSAIRNAPAKPTPTTGGIASGQGRGQ